MTTHPSDPIDYLPEPLTPAQRWRITQGLVNREVREREPAEAAVKNAPLRAAEADRHARQPGNAP